MQVQVKEASGRTRHTQSPYRGD